MSESGRHRAQSRCWQASWLWPWYERVAMHLGLGSLALLCLAWLPFALLLHLVLPRALAQRLGRQVIMRGFRFYLGLLETLCGCEFDLVALDALPAQGPLVIAANHPSLLDAVLIVSRLPDAVCVMKSALMRHPLFGAAARLARYIRNDGLVQIVQQSREALQDGAQVLMFPEGTRTTAFPLDPLTPTLGLIASRSHAPVQTVLLDFSTPYLGKAWPLHRRPVLPLCVTARLGRRFVSTGDHHAFTRELEAYLREALATPPTVPAAHD